jgi:tripartite-type tricarboxylate transporter receptor subunit TctC
MKSLLGVLALTFAAASAAQDYPSKPMRMVVGFPPGGGTDVVARILVPRLTEQLGQTVFIENRPGATGTTAAAMVATSPGDGYTIMMGHVSVNAIAPSLFSNLAYDVIRDFAPVAITAAVPHIVTTHPSLAVNSLKELIAHLKANRGKLTFPSAGNGSMPAASPHVRSGKLRALAVSSAARQAAFPDLPTAEEADLPGYLVTTWYGVFAPPATPAPIVARLHAEIVKAMQTPDVRAKLDGIGADNTVSRSPAEFAALVRADTVRYAKIVKDIGLKLD